MPSSHFDLLETVKNKRHIITEVPTYQSEIKLRDDDEKVRTPLLHALVASIQCDQTEQKNIANTYINTGLGHPNGQENINT